MYSSDPENTLSSVSNLPHHEEVKTCKGCGKDFPKTEQYFKKVNERRGHVSICAYCIDCYNANRRQKRADDPEHRDDIERKRRRAIRRSPEKYMVIKARKRAKLMGYDFNIDESDIVIPKRCPLLGIELINGIGKGTQGEMRDHFVSIDRIDSSKGYVKGNVWVISYRANRLKADATLEELQLITKNLRKKLKKEKNT
jgi:hypothetical protein